MNQLILKSPYHKTGSSVKYPFVPRPKSYINLGNKTKLQMATNQNVHICVDNKSDQIIKSLPKYIHNIVLYFNLVRRLDDNIFPKIFKQIAKKSSIYSIKIKYSWSQSKKIKNNVITQIGKNIKFLRTQNQINCIDVPFEQVSPTKKLNCVTAKKLRNDNFHLLELLPNLKILRLSEYNPIETVTSDQCKQYANIIELNLTVIHNYFDRFNFFSTYFPNLQILRIKNNNFFDRNNNIISEFVNSLQHLQILQIDCTIHIETQSYFKKFLALLPNIKNIKIYFYGSYVIENSDFLTDCLNILQSINPYNLTLILADLYKLVKIPSDISSYNHLYQFDHLIKLTMTILGQNTIHWISNIKKLQELKLYRDTIIFEKINIKPFKSLVNLNQLFFCNDFDDINETNENLLELNNFISLKKFIMKKPSNKFDQINKNQINCLYSLGIHVIFIDLTDRYDYLFTHTF